MKYQTLFPLASKITVKERVGDLVKVIVHTPGSPRGTRLATFVFDDGLTVKRTVKVPGWSRPVLVL